MGRGKGGRLGEPSLPSAAEGREGTRPDGRSGQAGTVTRGQGDVNKGGRAGGRGATVSRPCRLKADASPTRPYLKTARSACSADPTSRQMRYAPCHRYSCPRVPEKVSWRRGRDWLAALGAFAPLPTATPISQGGRLASSTPLRGSHPFWLVVSVLANWPTDQPINSC